MGVTICTLSIFKLVKLFPFLCRHNTCSTHNFKTRFRQLWLTNDICLSQCYEFRNNFMSGRLVLTTVKPESFRDRVTKRSNLFPASRIINLVSLLLFSSRECRYAYDKTCTSENQKHWSFFINQLLYVPFGNFGTISKESKIFQAA